MEQSIITAGHTRVGWIGTGVMGLAMCARVQAAGFHITVYARTPAKICTLYRSGAASVESPKAVGECCDVVFTMLSNPSDVRQVVLGTDGVLSALAPGGILIDMTSSQPSLAKEIFEQATAKGCDSVDAPVSGGDRGAQNGTLAILAGGRQETVAKLDPLFRCMGSATYLGPAGSGQSCKIANQITVAANLGGLSEGLVFARKAGLDLRKYLSAIGGGAAQSFEAAGTEIETPRAIWAEQNLKSRKGKNLKGISCHSKSGTMNLGGLRGRKSQLDSTGFDP